MLLGLTSARLTHAVKCSDVRGCDAVAQVKDVDAPKGSHIFEFKRACESSIDALINRRQQEQSRGDYCHSLFQVGDADTLARLASASACDQTETEGIGQAHIACVWNAEAVESTHKK